MYLPVFSFCTKCSKGALICILKVLKIKGYYKKELNLSNDDFIRVAQQTFQVHMSIDNAKKVDADSFDTSFIPYASTLP
jgi:hypothetical protein